MNILRRMRDLFLGRSSRDERAEGAAVRDFARRLEALSEAKATARLKLGRSWSTRRLSPGTRRARLAKLTRDERAAARSMGWIR